MKLSEIINEYEITVNLEAEDKLEAIEELVDLLISEHEVSLRDRDSVLQVVFAREASVSTGVGGGVALPHGTVDCIEEIVGAVGISRKGIEFDAIDGEPVYIVLLLLVPKAKITKHIKTLANIARIFNEESLRKHIRSAKTPELVLQIIENAEEKYDM
jgi:mannitol/fructose-specific phosphotransferase system IIA component (Ntr-type)